MEGTMAAVLAAALTALLALVALAVVSLRGGARAGVAERALQRYRLALDHLPESGFLVLGRSLRVELAAGGALACLGLRAAVPAGARLRDELHPDAWPVLEPALRAALEGASTRLHLPAGGRDHALHVLPLPGGRSRTDGVLVAVQDVTERRSRERGLSALASTDGLTGLWNRRRLEHELEQILRGDRVEGAVLLFVDLDGFKAVNDTLGHEAGDDLLRRIARVLESSVRRTDIVARVGGDEFAVLLPRMTDLEARAVADKIAKAVGGVWPLGLAGGASVGVAVADRRHSSSAAVLAAADRAMYSLKRSGRMAQAS
jgi:diguanylate cyclase (GGDEF)-like protein